ncbi:MAG: hypothetical protein KF803_16310 [Cyclobacteriaceae bacterium]|nr:hypothetical protein [Cyclobacteriaceae bacterium]
MKTKVRKVLAFIIVGLPVLATFILCFVIMSLVLPDDFRPKKVVAFSSLFFCFLIVVFILLLGQKERLAGIFLRFNGFLNVYGRLVYRLSIVLITYTVLLLILFNNFNKWPENFLVNGELKERHSELEKSDIKRQITSINQSEQLLSSEKAELGYIYKEILNFKKTDSAKYQQFMNGDRLFINDSIILVFHSEFGPPSSEPFIRLFVHNKSGEQIKEHLLYGTHYVESIYNRLNEIDSRLSKSYASLDELNKSSSVFRLSLLSFISYYLNNQLQPLTTTMKFVDLLASFMSWVFLVVVASEILPPIFKRLTRASN